MSFIIPIKLTHIFLLFSDTGPGAEDNKRRHRSSQSDESKTGNKKVNIPSSPLPSQVHSYQDHTGFGSVKLDKK